MTSISRLIELEQTTDKVKPEWFDYIHDQAIKLDIKATSDLRAFKSERVTHSDKSKEVILRPVESNTPPQVTLLANRAWALCDGAKNPKRARAILKESRTEYTRAAFDTVLFYVRMISIGEFRKGIALPRGFLENVKTRLWQSADEISRQPISPFWIGESAASTLENWCSRQNRAKAKSSDHSTYMSEMLCGIALTWIDEAISNPHQCLALMAEVADAMRTADFYGGWSGHESVHAEEKSSRGKKMANVRHKTNRDNRTKAINMYKTGNYSSKDTAAGEIAPKLGVAYRTARDWLKGLKPDGVS